MSCDENVRQALSL